MFPKNSAFSRDAMSEAAGIVPSPENSGVHPAFGSPPAGRVVNAAGEFLQRRKADAEEKVRRTYITVPITEYEDWIHSLDLSENGGDVQDIVDEMRVYLP